MKVCKCRQDGEGSEEEGQGRWGEDEDEASAAEESKRRMKHQPDGGLKEEERNGMHALPWLSKCVFI